MKKIGFIDYFLDEWHANNYPKFIKDAVGDEFVVAYAYGEIDSPNGKTNREWADSFGVELLGTIDEVIEKSDVLIVLSPDHPERHSDLLSRSPSAAASASTSTRPSRRPRKLRRIWSSWPTKTTRLFFPPARCGSATS